MNYKWLSERIIKIAAGVLVAVIIQQVSMIIGDLINSLMPDPQIGSILGTGVYIILALTAGIFYTEHVLHLSVTNLGLKKTMPEWNWWFIGVVLPVTVTAFYLLFMNGEIERNVRLTHPYSTVIFAVFECGIGAGVVEEFIFRGLIMRIFEKYAGKKVAIIVPSVLFGLMHIANISSWSFRDAAMLIVAGTSVGIMFSVIAMTANSIWASAVVHGLWNIFIVGEIFQIGTAEFNASIDIVWKYTISSQNILLTGGRFGIEAAMPAIIGYWIVTILVVIQGLTQKKG